MKVPVARNFLLFGALLWGAAFAVSPARAQSTIFTYQGLLEDAGNPANGRHDFRFLLFDAATAGAPVASPVCADDVDVVDGVFTVQLDFGQQFATMAQRYLEIEVRRDTGLTCASVAGFVALAPRQQLTASPLSIHANSAFALDAPDGAPLGAVMVDNDGKVGIGTNTPGVPLHLIAPNTGATPGEGIRIQGTLSTGSNLAYLSFANGAGTALGYVGDGGGGENNIYLGAYGGDLGLVNSTFGTVLIAKSTGLVGIGTTAPAAKLDVRGDIKLGTSGQYFAVKSPTNDRSIRGAINANGTIDASRSSTGFTITKSSTGVYSINFTVAFASPPTVVVSGMAQCCRARVTTTATNSAFVHVLSYATDALTDAPFHFIAMGP